MNKNSPQRLYELYDKANELGHFYHDLDSPLVADEIYDALIHEIELIENEHPEWVREDSPSKHVSGIASKSYLKKVIHEEPLLSLMDKFSTDEVRDWYDNLKLDILELATPAFDVEMKIDGLSVELEYNDGIFVRASTRGDGKVGEDVTDNIRQVRGIPFDIKDRILSLDSSFNGNSILKVRIEVVMLNDDFKKANREREISGEPLYANPRNAAAGILRTINSELVKSRGLTSIAFSILHSKGFNDISCNIKPGYSQINDLCFLDALGFNTVSRRPCQNFNEIIESIDNIQKMRMNLPYWIDGAVVKVNNIEMQKKLGATSKYPHWAVAYKYLPEEKTTHVTNIIIQAGRTGILTPKVEFEPVILGGTKVQYATLHNPGQIKALGGIAIGDQIDINKAADIIPQVVRVYTQNRHPSTILFEITHCPSCGSDAKIINKDGIETAYCVNKSCPAKKQKYFEYVVSRDVLNIIGMGPAVISTLINNGILESLVDIFTLKEKQSKLESLAGFGKKRVTNLLSSIENSKNQSLNRVFASLGIRECGTHIGEILENKYSDIWEISKLNYDELILLNGIGDVIAAEITKYFACENNIKLLKELESLGVNMKSSHQQKDFSNLPLLNLKFVITGALKNMTRKVMEKFIKEKGGHVLNTITRQVDYLIVGDKPGSKVTKALELKVPVITEDEFYKMIDTNS